EFSTTQARLQQERSESEKATRELGEARSRVETLIQRVTDLDRQLILQVKEAEMLGNRVNDLEARLGTQAKLLAERDYENKQLRQRINDIAAEVAKLAMQLEGPNSPIEAMLATEPAALPKSARPANGAAASGATASGGDSEGGGTLAERIRALQSHASRA